MRMLCCLMSAAFFAATVGVAFAAGELYVSPDGSNTPPYDSWETAAHTVPAAIAECDPGDTIYIGSSDFYLYGIDATSGVVKWSVSLGAPVISKPTSAYGRVYASTMDNILYAVDTKTHSILWQLEADRVITATRNRVIFVRRTPAGDRVGIADSADGRVLGEIPAGRYETFVAEPESGIFYAISPQGDVLAIAEKGLKKGER